MKTRFFENSIRGHLLLIIVIGAVLSLGVFVNDALGIAQINPPPGCSPCDVYDFDIWCSLTFRCMGCIADCGNCFSCDTSTNPPRCKEKCKYFEECKDCNYGSDLCSKCVGCQSICVDGNTPCIGPYGCNCCNPNLCQTCIGGECKPCNNDPNKACCNGQCYDIRTQQCCQDITPAYICDINQPCCYGNCCRADQCCDANNVCKDPICDNCHCYDRTFNECFHWATDPNGAPCFTTGCIHNEMSTATCDYHSDSTCPSKCTAQVQATGTACWQTVYAGPCSGGQVNWQSFVTFYTGCPTCTGWDPGPEACQTNECYGEQVGFPMEHGELWDCTGTCP